MKVSGCDCKQAQCKPSFKKLDLSCERQALRFARKEWQDFYNDCAPALQKSLFGEHFDVGLQFRALQDTLHKVTDGVVDGTVKLVDMISGQGAKEEHALGLEYTSPEGEVFRSNNPISPVLDLLRNPGEKIPCLDAVGCLLSDISSAIAITGKSLEQNPVAKLFNELFPKSKNVTDNVSLSV